jgi:hypothetical protein
LKAPEIHPSQRVSQEREPTLQKVARQVARNRFLRATIQTTSFLLVSGLTAGADRVRAAHVKILAQKDRALERRLLRANLDSPRHLDEMLLYEERLSRAQRRCVLDLNRYGRKLERIMNALLRL